MITDAAKALPAEPHVQFAGPVDTLVGGQVADELARLLRELLSNVARHAQASEIAVDVTVDDVCVTLTVDDDGVGLPAATGGGGRGLENLATRARRLGGSFEIGPRADAGTVAVWRVPLRSVTLLRASPAPGGP